jgi:xanthine dehydrogenase accessory factor
LPTWVEALARLNAEGRPAALLTVLKVNGSTPREAGAKLLVTAEGWAWGSIGGGPLERAAIEDAKSALDEGACRVATYGFCGDPESCGGNAEVLIEVLNAGPHLLLFGAGHVGHALCRVLEGTGHTVHLVDSRPEWLDQPGIPPGVIRHPEGWEAFLPTVRWHPRTRVVVATHGGDLDRAILRAVLPLAPGFVGLLGSRAKAARMRAGLVEDGLPEALVARLRCPLGLDLGPRKAPQEVAIAIAAQLVGLD